ncbi:MAG TPA: NADH-quinone oxidoreductase subunit L [Acidobacteriaceae bacterium]|nr:NADH-quinone oxidoreductase subunit L [Acidobacteriaceae bacterium]
MNSSLHLWLIPLVPFAGFVLNGLIGRKLPKALVTAIALIATLIPFAQVSYIWFRLSGISLPYIEHVGTWIQTGTFRAGFDLQLDHLTMVMLLVVTGVGFVIHVFSVGYMEHEEGYWRFFAYMNLFMFFMLTLVLAENFLLMFVGWEGVGLASYLLIGFYYLRTSAAKAGKKAFVVNRIGDFGFLIALFLLIWHFGTLNFSTIFSQITQHPEWQGGFLTAIALFLVLGATGKSAQIPLYVWLPDAMEGPTPVSALIHAATMVTAGVYMIARTHVIFDRSPLALTVVAIIGAATAFVAATIGVVQTDIKRVLAYSTVSQIGYMFLACGVASYASGIFHLVTHAFFKALLFLAAGSVIHALNGEQDMRAMGGLWKKMPVTFWTMTSAVFAISGIPPFAGFFSKDEILYLTFLAPNGGKLLWLVGLVTAGLTSFYMFRLWYMTFFGETRYKGPSLAEHGAAVHASSTSKLVLEAEPEGHGHGGIHESPWVMLVPLIVLGILSLIGGWIGVPVEMRGNNDIGHFLGPALNVAGALKGSDQLAFTLAIVSTLTAGAGWLTAHVLYYAKPELPEVLTGKIRGVYALVANKYWVDEIYGAIFVTPLLMVSKYLLQGLLDTGVIGGTTYGGAYATQGFGAIVQRVQSGNIRSYAGWLALGAAVLLIVTYFGFSAHFGLR